MTSLARADACSVERTTLQLERWCGVHDRGRLTRLQQGLMTDQKGVSVSEKPFWMRAEDEKTLGLSLGVGLDRDI